MVNEGWISGMAENLSKISDIELTICYPQNEEKRVIKDRIGSIELKGYYTRNEHKYEEHLKRTLSMILREKRPDIVHIMGTEYPHTLSMVEACEACGLASHTVISIQGLVSECCKYVDCCLPRKVIHIDTAYGIYKNDTVLGLKRNFEKRGTYEILAIQKAKNIIGRTDWDEACVKKMNTNLHYYFNNEILRSTFYGTTWDIETCERHTIFVSQATYALKGFHILLQAMPLILQYFPDAIIKVAGYNRLQYQRPIYKMTKYDRYIYKLMIQNHLQGHVDFLGPLQEKDMVKQYQQAHVYVGASFIENSPNSLGEAMILGVPCVSSDVGGVKNLLKHGEEGFLYQSDMPYMLAYYVCKLFSDDRLAVKFSKNAREHALKTHDRETNVKCLLKIYEKLLRNEG
jgi:glycosyltransferase involved in cell wall biosynthesis